MWLDHFTTHILNRLTAPRARPAPAGLTIGTTTEPPHRRVVLSDRHRCEHAVILGKTGSGKTHLLEVLALAIARRREGFALIDFHGDVSSSLISRLAVTGDADRLVILDPSHPTLSPGLNVLEATGGETDRFRKVSELSSILRQRWGVDAFGARTEELLRNSLYVLAAKGLTLADLPRLLTDAPFRTRCTAAITHTDIQMYWRDRYEPLSEAMKGAFREPLLNRVTGFLTEPAARHLLAQPRSTIDIDAVIRDRKWLIIRLPKGRLREHAHTLGNLIFAQLQFAALARDAIPRAERHTFTLLCDEAQNLAENDLGTLLTEGRKFGISVITANQFWEQLPRELRGALLSANALICFRLSSADASVLASELSAQRRHHVATALTGLTRGEAIGSFGADGLAHVRVPALPDAVPINERYLTELLSRVTRPRADVEAEIIARARPVVAPPPVVAQHRTRDEGHHGW
jgi:hypothetical protein